MLKSVAAKGTVLKEMFIHPMDEVTRYCRPATMYPTVFSGQEFKH
jgi:hypothetical protein